MSQIDYQSIIFNANNVYSIDEEDLKLETLKNLHNAFIQQGKVYVKEGRVTKALEVYNKGVSILSDVKEWDDYRADLQIGLVCLAFETNLGVDLLDKDVISPITLVALATEVENHVAKFGIETGKQKLCCLEWNAYDAVLAQVANLLELMKQTKNEEIQNKVKGIYIAACIRSAMVTIRSSNIDQGYKLAQCAKKMSDESDWNMRAKCSFALGLLEISKVHSVENLKLNNRLRTRALEYHQDALKIYQTEIDEPESTLVIKIEIGKTYFEMGQYVECIKFILDISDKEMLIINSKCEEHIHHWPVLEALLQKAYLRACKEDSSNEKLKEAYRLLLTKKDNLEHEQLLKEISELTI